MQESVFNSQIVFISPCSISTERHRAEIRRAVNDEKFATVAEHLAGSNTGGEWAIEGRRLVPLLPRLVPQTVFTLTANQAASMAQVHNMTLPPPAETARKEGNFLECKVHYTDCNKKKKKKKNVKFGKFIGIHSVLFFQII